MDSTKLNTAVNDIMELRRSINEDMPAKTDSREARALLKTKRALDEFVQDAFESDMVNGSPAAIKRWQEANQNWSEFKDLFDDDRTLVKIWRDDLNADQIKRLIFNKNAVSAKASAGPLVAKLKTILGEDAPQIEALQNTVLQDIVDPVLKYNPDLKGFAENWRKFKKDNGDLMNELFDQETVSEMDDFARMSWAMADVAEPALARGFSIPRVVSVLAFGHNMAKAAARRMGAQRLMEYLSKPSREQVILNKAFGLDRVGPMLPGSKIDELSTYATAREEGEK